MAKAHDVIFDREAKGYFVTTVPALKGWYNQAKLLDELMRRVQEVFALCLEVEGPALESLEFVDLQCGRVA